VAVAVHLFGPRSDEVRRDIADDLEDPPVVVDGIGRVRRGILRPRPAVPREPVLLDSRDRRQVDVVEEELNVVVIFEEVRHDPS